MLRTRGTATIVLLGVAVDPEWATDHHVYFMHTASEGNRVARTTYDGTTLTDYQVLLQGIRKNRYHNGGRLAFDRNGRLWEAEFGNSSKDELNLIKPGANYGRPICEGSCTVAGMTDPKATWGVAEASPSGIAIVRNVVYMASLRGERLWRIPIDGDSESVGTPTAYYVGTYGRLRTVTKVPGADQLWLSTTNSDNNGGEPDGSDKILRVDIS